MTPNLPPPVEETQSPTGYIPPPVIDSTVGNPGAFTDVTDDLPQPDIAQDPQAVAPHVKPATLNAPEPAEPEAVLTEALVDEPTSYFVEPMSESIKDFEPVDHADNTPEFREVVHGNPDVIFPEPHHEKNGEAADYYRGDVIPTTGEVVLENANVVLGPNLGHREEPEAHDHDVGPAATERERQEEPQQKSEPILIPLPNYNIPSYSMNLGSEREVWGGDHDHGAYPSSVPVVNPSSEDIKRVERSPAPSVRFIDLIFFRELVPKLNPHLEWHLQTHLQILLLRESQFLSRYLTCLSTLTLYFSHHYLHLLIVYRPEFAENYQQESAETHSHDPIVMPVPSFVDHHRLSMSSLKNGNTRNLIETESVFSLTFFFCFLNLFSVQRNSSSSFSPGHAIQA